MKRNLRFQARQCLFILASLLLTSQLVGCITTTKGGFTEKASPQKALERRVSLARQYIGEGNWDDAKRNLQMAYEIDPNNAEVHEAFALIYQSTGEFELAKENFEKAIKLDRRCSRCRNNYAAYLYSQGEFRDAEVQLEQVVKDSLYPGRPHAFVNLGLCRQQLADPDGAQEAFLRALSMERTNQIALLEVAQLRFEAGDYVEAHKHYDTYLRVARQQSARGLWLGIRLARQKGDKDTAASFGLSLSSRFPDSVEYREYTQGQQGD